MMENLLSYYLFRCLRFKPKGLRLKLKVVAVNDWLETFNELEHPVATIVPHGLFLARPTPEGVKDPVLLGVINHRNLQDEEPQTPYKISYTTPQFEVAVGHEIRKILKLSKSGIEKIFARSVESEYHEPDHVMYRSETYLYGSLNDHTVHHKFFSFMQSVVDAYNSSLPTQLASNTSSMYQDSLKIAQPLQFKLSKFDGGFVAIGEILSELHSSVMYFSMFLPPQQTSNDSNQYEALVNLAHRDLHSMSKAIMEVLLEPLWDTLMGYNSENNQTPDWHDICLSVKKGKFWVEQLVELSETPSREIYGLNRLENLEYKDLRFGDQLTEVFSYILGVPSLASQLFCNLADKLNEFSVRPKSLQEAQAFMNLQLLMMIENVEQGSPEICIMRNTRTNNSFRFYPGIDTSRTWRVMAIFVIQSAKIVILVDTKCIPKLAKLETTAYVQVFRNGAPSASFLLPLNGLLEVESMPVCMEHFTGRYFVKFQTQGYNKPKELVLVDFAPCICETPKPPIILKQDINSIIHNTSSNHYLISYTDQFAALMITEVVIDITNTDQLHKPVRLQILKFDSSKGFEALLPVCCKALFDSLNRGSARDIVFRNAHSNSQIRWWKDLRTFYYTNWILPGEGEDSTAVFIACIRVSSVFDSMKFLAFERLPLKPLLTEFYSDHRRPDLQILHTRVKEYLVMDIKDRLDLLSSVAIMPNRIYTRVMFAVHRNKLQRVLVNGMAVSRFPQHIGTQMKYAGYETSHMSLFHQRRVFCSNKVVSAVHRLDYKPS